MNSSSRSGPLGFQTTRWSVVLEARRDGSPAARAALETLALSYWYPLYAFLRRRGVADHEAADLTQGLFARLLEQDAFASLEPTGGRFRSYLRTAVLHLLRNERERDSALKRGGDRIVLSFDAIDAEQRYLAEPSHVETPERLFEQSFARSVLERAMERLRRSYVERGQELWFERLQGRLTGDGSVSLAEDAEQYGVSEGSLKVALHRLRKRYGECLRSEVLDTLSDPGDLDDELRFLLQSLG